MFNLVLGGMPEHYGQASGRLHPGDCLVLYTDGVTEAFNPEGQMFGDERLHELVRQHVDASAQTLVTHIFASVIEFAGTAPQSDDITLAVLAWCPPTTVNRTSQP